MLPLRLPVSEVSQVSDARRRVEKLAVAQGYLELERAKIALVVTEMATNLVKHTREGGEILVQVGTNGTGAKQLDIMALDRGPGIANVAQALGDGYSTTIGSAGTGLGAIRRAADAFELHVPSGSGVAMLARFSEEASTTPATFEVGALRVPHPNETVCGDDLAWHTSGGRWLGIVVDGLGHGVLANEAAEQAVRAFRANQELPPEELLGAIHLAMRPTRGGVAAVVCVDRDRKVVEYAGIGNISGVIYSEGGTRNMVSFNGTLGQDVRKFQSFTYPWAPGSILVMHSDGLSNRWDLAAQSGLTGKSATLIAAVLYRDHSRGRDDNAVLVMKESA